MHETLHRHQQIADAAVGLAAAPPAPAVRPMPGEAGPHPPACMGGAGLHDATRRLQQARWHLAQADA